MRKIVLAFTGALGIIIPWEGAAMTIGDVAAGLPALKTSVLKADEIEAAKAMLRDDVRERVKAVCAQEDLAFEKVQNLADWERFRDDRLDLMRISFGPMMSPGMAFSSDAGYMVTGTVTGDNLKVQNLVIAGRSGQPITANLYSPSVPVNGMPGILIVTSHHDNKWHGELQDMGMTWARSGCAVMVMDAIGYGERRQQVFGGREDYRWRYHLGMQLQTVGESLMAWMVADLRRGLDVLSGLPGIDAKRLIVIGSVAGGGDLAGVVAATDSRVACSIPFNYGSASVVTGEDAWVNSIGGGDFDATRCPRNSGRDGFVPWLVVAACAPRYTTFAKEFDWNPEGDKGFARIARVFEFYGASNRLEAIHGHGNVTQSASVASHCNNVGPVHRQALYPILNRWLKMEVPQEYQAHLTPEVLTCITPAARKRWPMRPVHEVLAEQAAQQVSVARKRLESLTPKLRAAQLRKEWGDLLGDVTPVGLPEVLRRELLKSDGYSGERLLLSMGRTIRVPVLLLKPGEIKGGVRVPVVIGVAQEGKDVFLAKRAAEVAELLGQGFAVCLVDVRGTGETMPAGERYWYSSAVELAGLDLALGQTTLGGRVRDLRCVLRYLQSRGDVDGRRVGVWGESFAPANPSRFVDPPMQTSVSAMQVEPMGGTVALLLALFEDDVSAVVSRGGLTGYTSLMEGAACHVVMDAVVPGVLEHGDMADVVGVLAPRAVRVEGAVDGRNRLVGRDRLNRDFEPALKAYQGSPDRLILSVEENNDVAEWLGLALKETVQSH